MRKKVAQSFYVYLHRRKTDGTIFYVGKGSGTRAWKTVGRSKKWQAVASKHGLVVEIVQSGMQEWWAFELEMQLILASSPSLCNLTDGGEGASGLVLSRQQREALRSRTTSMFEDESFRAKHQKSVLEAMSRPDVIEKISSRTKAAMACPDIRQKISSRHKGVPLSDEHKQSLSKARKGKPKSEEHKAALSSSAKLRGQFVSDEAIKKAAAANLGRQFTDEHRAAVSAGLRRKWSDPEHRAKISAAMKQRVFTEEHRRKLSEAAKRRNQLNRQEIA